MPKAEPLTPNPCIMYDGRMFNPDALTDDQYRRALTVGVEHMLAIGEIEYDAIAYYDRMIPARARTRQITKI